MLFGLLLFIIIIFNLLSNSSSNTAKSSYSKNNYPVGIYLLSYMGDPEGRREEDLNTVEITSGKKINIIEFLNSYSNSEAFIINEDGSGIYKCGENGCVERKIQFYNDYFETEGGTQITYSFDGEKLWSTYHINVTGTDLENIDPAYIYDSGNYLKVAPWEKGNEYTSASVFEKSTKELLDLAFEGKSGSVPLKDAKVGDKVCIGTFDQFPGNNKTEAIYWRVIDEKEGKLLLLSDKLLDSFAFNNKKDENDTATWETSSLRQFLNNDFLNTCFTEKEQKLIETTHLTNEECNEILHNYWGNLKDIFKNGINYTYSEINNQNQKSSNDTDDKIFILSLNELLKYFPLGNNYPTEEDGEEYPFTEFKVTPEMIAYVTLSVDDNGSGYYDKTTLGGAYLTRTLSSPRNQVVYVTGDGQLFQYYNYASLFIRPAMWINVNN